MMTILYILEVAFGIGLVIFLHEMGHFLMCRRVGVRVEVFSLGFGTRLIGFRKGETDYRISAIPFGGYVKMAGETPSMQGTGRPDEFPSKPVGQRALIVSGGVIMNFLTGMVLFVLAFTFGVKFFLPVVGTVRPGSDAQKAGLKEGDRIISVGGKPVSHFRQLGLAIAFSGDGEDVEIVVERRGEEGLRRVPIVVRPEKDEVLGYPELDGLYPPLSTLVASVDQGSAAAGAVLASDGKTPFPIEVGDVIVDVGGVHVGPLDGVTFVKEIFDRPGEDVPLRIRRGVEVVTVDDGEDGGLRHRIEYRGGKAFEVIVRPKPRRHHVIGAYPRDHAVIVDEIVEGSPCFGALRKGDKILRVEGEDARVRSLRRETKFSRGRPIHFTVERDGEELDLTVTPRFFGGDGKYMLGFLEKSLPVVGKVDPGSPADRGGLEPGDVVLELDGVELNVERGIDRERWSLIEVSAGMGRRPGEPMVFNVKRGGETLELKVVPEPRDDLVFGYSGIGIRPAGFSLRSANLVEAGRLGIRGTIDWVGNVFLTFRSLFSRRVDPKNIGGPVMIAESSYHFAKQGFGTILYFLGIISVNLAILNVLPIPVLDGGLLFFLLIEKLKGSPVKEKYLIAANYVGLALLLFLMLYVTGNDIWRLIQR